MEGMQSQDASLERLERNINVMKAKVTAAPVIPPEPPPPRNPAPMVFTVNDDDDDDPTPPAKTPKRSVPGTTLNPGPRDADDEPAPKKRKPGVIVAPSKIYRLGLPSLYRDPRWATTSSTTRTGSTRRMANHSGRPRPSPLPGTTSSNSTRRATVQS